VSLLKSEDGLPTLAKRSFDRITKHLSPSVGGIYTTQDEKIIEHLASCVFVRFRNVEY